MIEVRVVARPKTRDPEEHYTVKRSVDFGANLKESGNKLENMLFRNQYECAKLFLTTLSDTQFNAKAICKIAHGEFSADGFVEVWDPVQKELLDSAIQQLMRIGEFAKYCNGSAFKLELDQKISLIV